MNFIQKVQDEETDHKLLDTCLKVKELEPEPTKHSKDNFGDVNFWANKGYQMSQEDNVNNALDYYFQGLKRQSEYFLILYNLG